MNDLRSRMNQQKSFLGEMNKEKDWDPVQTLTERISSRLKHDKYFQRS